MEENKIISTVSLEELEFNPIHKIINYKNNQGETKQITIFNLNEKQEKDLLEVLMKYSNAKNKEIKFDIPQTSVFAEIFPLLTDIQMPSDEESIERIINNPNTVLKEVLLEVTQQLTKIMEVNFKSMEIQKKSLEVAGIDDEKLIELVDKQKEIKSMEIDLEKEKQETSKVEATKNDELVKELLQKVNKLETEKLEVMAENEKLKEVKSKRKYNKKNKVKDVVESKEGENLGQ